MNNKPTDIDPEIRDLVDKNFKDLLWRDPTPLDSEIDRILSKCWCDEHRCSKVQNLQGTAHKAIKDLIATTVNEVIGTDSEHTVDAQAHINNPMYQYACCERVQANNVLRATQRTKLQELLNE